MLQTIVCLLRSLDPADDWIELCIEPTNLSEKVDVRWRYPDGRTKVVQIKSSQNLISKPEVEAWAQQLEKSCAATTYELHLLGHCSGPVTGVGSIGKVQIPTPQSINPGALVVQAAHHLDRYLEVKGASKVPSLVRELIVSGLVTELETYSTSGSEVSRKDFDRQLERWLFALYPRTLEEAVNVQCDVLLDTAYLTRGGHATTPGMLASDEFHIVVPMTFVNGGVRTAIVEWVAARVRLLGSNDTKLYVPSSFVDHDRYAKGGGGLHPDHIVSVFRVFPVIAGQLVERTVQLSREFEGDDRVVRPWSNGLHEIDLYVKYRHREAPSLQLTLQPNIDAAVLQQMRANAIGRMVLVNARKIVL